MPYTLTFVEHDDAPKRSAARKPPRVAWTRSFPTRVEAEVYLHEEQINFVCLFLTQRGPDDKRFGKYWRPHPVFVINYTLVLDAIEVDLAKLVAEAQRGKHVPKRWEWTLASVEDTLV